MSQLEEEDPAAVSGADAVAILLRHAGVRQVFGYAGTSELALASALQRHHVAYRNARGDKEACFMAGGASSFQPALAAALVHGARGLTNAAGALGDVWRNETGFVCLVGLPSRASQAFLPPHGEPGLLASIGGLTKAWFEVPGPEEADVPSWANAHEFVRMVREAVRLARARPCGPVLIGLAQDIMEARWIPRTLLEPTTSATVHPQQEPPAEAIMAIEAAERPVVLLDDYFLKHPQAIPVLRRFTGALGAPAFQVRYRRGPMLFERVSPADVPAFAGWYEPTHRPHVETTCNADLLITLEDRNMYSRVIGGLPAVRKVAFTTAPERTLKNRYLTEFDTLVAGDPCANLATVMAALGRPARTLRLPAPPPPKARPAAAAAMLAGIAGALGAVLADMVHPVIVDDSQMFGGLLCDAYDRLPTRTRVIGDHGGFVGGGLPTAVGLALSDDRLGVLCLLGDQGFTNGLQGLVAAVEHRSQVCFLVCNNGGSVSLCKQLAAFDSTQPAHAQRHLANAEGFDYLKVASAFGMPVRRVVWPYVAEDASTREAGRQLADAIREHRDHRGPSLVELVLPSHMQAWTGVWNVAGLEQLTIEALT